jgi:signal transduction histidine kinase
MLRLEAQTARETERARIAQDLHDDLGASLTEISMLAQIATEDRAATGASHDALSEIAGKAQRLVGALDEIVWAVNPRHDTLASLVDYLAASASEFLDSAGIALRLDVPQELPAIPIESECRHGLFLVVREALNNVVKHSGATEVQMRLKLDATRLEMAIEDNGRGIANGPAERDEGLRGLYARMAKLGGECRIESAQDEGTSVRFLLPFASNGA